MTDEPLRKALALGPEDLARVPVRPVDYEKLDELITRHLEDHLPMLVDEAVANAVEPIARTLTTDLRNAVLKHLDAERAALIDDILAEFRQSRGE